VGKSKNETKTVQAATTTSTPTGTPFAAPILAQTQGLSDKLMSQQAFTGDRVAAPAALDQYVAQWGQTPSTIVAQRQATDNPTEANITHVDRNYQPGIDAGLAAATQNRDLLDPLLPQMYSQWGNILQGQGNPNLQAVINNFQTEHNESSQQQNNQMLLASGAQGAYGLDTQKGLTWLGEQQAQEHDSTVSRLLYDDYLNNQQMLLQAPGALGQMQALGMMPAEQLLTFGNLGQQNQRDAAAVGDQNAQIANNNQHAALSLIDTNAQLAATNAMAVRDANYQGAEAQVANNVAAANAGAQRDQAGLDNNYLRWLAEMELLQSQIQGQAGIMQTIAGAPGGTTNQNSTSTTTQTQQAAPWQIAAGLGGAALQAFSPGGMFSGSLSALGGGANRLLPMPGESRVPALA